MYKPVELDSSEVTFASATSGVATVTEAGVVTGVKAGETKITATYGTLTDEITITVTAW